MSQSSFYFINRIFLNCGNVVGFTEDGNKQYTNIMYIKNLLKQDKNIKFRDL